MPVTLASWAATGSAIERGTDARAARWTMRSTPAAAPLDQWRPSTIEPSTRSSVEPVEVARPTRRQVVEHPHLVAVVDESDRQRLAPMNPAPPVTRTRTV